MVKFLVIVFFIYCPLTAGDDEEQSQSPCAKPLIMQARTAGLKSLRFYQLPAYYFLALKCKRQQKQNRIIKNDERRQLDQDYRRSRRLNGFSSSCAYLATVAVASYYLGQTLKKE